MDYPVSFSAACPSERPCQPASFEYVVAPEDAGATIKNTGAFRLTFRFPDGREITVDPGKERKIDAPLPQAKANR